MGAGERAQLGGEDIEKQLFLRFFGDRWNKMGPWDHYKQKQRGKGERGVSPEGKGGDRGRSRMERKGVDEEEGDGRSGKGKRPWMAWIKSLEWQ